MNVKGTAELQDRLDAVARELRALETRVASLESAARGSADPGGQTEPDPLSGESSLASLALVSLAGRSFLVLGGAYLLRAATEAALLPRGAGVALGFAYAAAWLWQCDRDARAGRRTSAFFHALAAVTAAFPLLWEATTRLAVLSGWASAAGLVALLCLGLAVALRHGQGAVAWLSTLVALGAGVALFVRTRELVPFSAALVVAAAIVEIVAWDARWAGLRWPAALAADGSVSILLAIVASPGLPEGYPPASGVQAAAVALLLPLVSVASLAARTLAGRRSLGFLDVAQTTLALILGLGGAARVLPSQWRPDEVVGWIALAVAVGGYASAVTVARQGREGATPHILAAAGFLLTLASGALLVAAPARALAFAALAAAGPDLGRRTRHAAWAGVHAVGYAVAAAVASGLLAAATDGLVAPAAAPWRAFTAAGLFSALGGAVAWIRVRSSAPRAAGPVRPLRTLAAALVAWCAVGLALRALADRGGPDPAPLDPMILATLRTVLLAGWALGLAAAGRRWDLEELRWLAPAFLAAGGLKLLLEDLPACSPPKLFLSLTAYGAALLVVPRLLGSRRAGAS